MVSIYRFNRLKMPVLGHFVIAILFLWNVLFFCVSQSASVENEQFITTVEVEDPENTSTEKGGSDLPGAWNQLLWPTRYIIGTDDSNGFILYPDGTPKAAYWPTPNKNLVSVLSSSLFPKGDSSKDYRSVQQERTGMKKQNQDTPFTLESEDSLDRSRTMPQNDMKNPNPGYNNVNSHPPQSDAYRTSKRSPKCLKKCLSQGLLHPAQCHSLC